jgi:2-hydroxychromene-2-carboxylate isomerase
MVQATFFYDLGSPFVYLAAERMDAVLPAPVTWQPVSLGALFKLTGRSSWGMSATREPGMADVERRAQCYGLPPIRWPDPWPGHYLMAMRAAIYAHSVGRGREFAMCALRHAFVEGNDLSVAANVLEAARRAARARRRPTQPH